MTTEALVYYETKFHFLEHEVIMILNGLHFCLLLYYIFFEILGCIFTLCGYSRLPKMYFKTLLANTLLADVISPIFKFLAVFGSAFALIGATSLRLVPLIIGLIVNTLLASYDLFLFFTGNFHFINPEDFLLCQTLFSSTFRFFGLAATFSNLALIFYSY